MTTDDGAADKRDIKIMVNCKTFAATFLPFGAVLVPNERTGDAAMYRYEDCEDGEWVAANQGGWPVTLKGRGESAQTTWTFSQGSDPAKLAGTWFYGGDLRQGLRAQALRCDLMLTERALRIGMSVGAFPKQGPWVLDDEKRKVVELTSHCVYAAVIPYEDIATIDGGKHYVEVHAGGAGLGMVGKIGRDASSGPTNWGSMDRFAVALTAAVLGWCRSSQSATKRAAAARIDSLDFADGLTRRRGMKLQFK